ncbi:TOMM precursor leader peptide-binding protein [Rhodococcus chondri]|uniref:TOMM leader peptide-binding protein n=1 Tax=Rhodococcus chondri TaxID=3065941 RepID=A0ABU7JMG6_9NOCA|nr:TOMM precursor leader peptide-binding protein [Rhodococcus sp. CC-R104]MEE2031232.1 TOMM precursor leader peptide-binding protein [Rhodococcus sp. CC-R104]
MTPSLDPCVRLALDPDLIVLRRPGGGVQLGWGPDTGVIVAPPSGMDTFDVYTVLRLLDGRHGRDAVAEAATAGRGADRAAVCDLLDELVAIGAVKVASPATESVDPAPPPRLRIYGNGPLTDALAANLTLWGTRLSRSSRYTDETEIAGAGVGYVLLTDAQVPDPRLVQDLMRHRVPHLVVRLRDGRGVVGPFVVPGRTSCLRCADLTRSDLDPSWPQLAVQLSNRVGRAERSVVLATAAVALGELDAILAGRASAPPTVIDRTVEVDLRTYRLSTRRWFRHPECACSTPRSTGQA